SFCPRAFFCTVWLTAWVEPPGPFELDEPHAAAETTSAQPSAHTTAFPIPYSFVVVQEGGTRRSSALGAQSTTDGRRSGVRSSLGGAQQDDRVQRDVAQAQRLHGAGRPQVDADARHRRFGGFDRNI